jgi:hypothetical protein
LTYWSRYDKGERVDIDEEEKADDIKQGIEMEGQDNETMSKASSTEAVETQPGASAASSRSQIAGG